MARDQLIADRVLVFVDEFAHHTRLQLPDLLDAVSEFRQLVVVAFARANVVVVQHFDLFGQEFDCLHAFLDRDCVFHRGHAISP